MSRNNKTIDESRYSQNINYEKFHKLKNHTTTQNNDNIDNIHKSQNYTTGIGIRRDVKRPRIICKQDQAL